MAVNIDTVYQRVLAIANKEQRGYVTPQEYNLYANQAQMDIFEQYFYDLNALNRIPGNDYTYADQVDIIQEKIDIFEKYRQTVVMSSDSNQGGMGTIPLYYRLGEIYCKYKGGYVEVEKVSQNEIHHIQNSPLTAPSLSRPVYVRTSGVVPDNDSDQTQTATTNNEIGLSRSIQIYPETITSNVVCNYIARPIKVEWAYTTVLDEALYNSTNSQDFELHQSDEPMLVDKILGYAGVMTRDQLALQLANSKEQQIDIDGQK